MSDNTFFASFGIDKIKPTFIYNADSEPNYIYFTVSVIQNGKTVYNMTTDTIHIGVNGEVIGLNNQIENMLEQVELKPNDNGAVKALVTVSSWFQKHDDWVRDVAVWLGEQLDKEFDHEMEEAKWNSSGPAIGDNEHSDAAKREDAAIVAWGKIIADGIRKSLPDYSDALMSTQTYGVDIDTDSLKYRLVYCTDDDAVKDEANANYSRDSSGLVTCTSDIDSAVAYGKGTDSFSGNEVEMCYWNQLTLSRIQAESHEAIYNMWKNGVINGLKKYRDEVIADPTLNNYEVQRWVKENHPEVDLKTQPGYYMEHSIEYFSTHWTYAEYNYDESVDFLTHVVADLARKTYPEGQYCVPDGC